MICKNKKIRRQIMSLLLTTVMTVSAFDATLVRADADEAGNESAVEYNNGDNVTMASRLVFPDGTPVNTESEDFDPTADYSEYGLGANQASVAQSEAVSVKKFESMVNNDADSSNDIDVVPTSDAADTSYPSSVDLSTSKYFPEIGNQHSIGSCVAWACVYYGFTYANCKAKDEAASADNIMSPAFVYNQVKESSGGTNEYYVFNALLSEGAPLKSMADFESYSSEDLCKSWFPQKEIWKNASEHRLTSYTMLSTPGTISSPDDSDLNQIKKYLNDGYLINITAQVTGCTNAYLKSGTPHAGELYRIQGGKGGYHEMTIVGYDDNIYYDINGDGTIQDAERGAFKVANSWGKEWGNDGFIWYAYDSINAKSQCLGESSSTRSRGLYDFVVQYVKPDGVKSSGLHMVTTLNTVRRNQAKITVVATKKSDNTQITRNVTVFFNCNIFACSLDGKQTEKNGTIAFDLNNVISNISIDNVNDYTWAVQIKDNSEDHNFLTLKEAYIEYNDDKIFEYKGSDKIVDGTSENVTLENVIGKKIGWDIEGNESTVNQARTLNAKLTDADKEISSATYKFVQSYNGTTKVLSDYSTSSTCRWVPKNPGTYTIIAYYKNGSDLYTESVNYTINEMPKTTKLNFSSDQFYVNSKVDVTAEFAGGTGAKALQAVYVVGGNYPYTSGTVYFKLTGANTASWTPDMDGEYTIYVTTKDSLVNYNLQNMGTITVNKAKPLTIKEFTVSKPSGTGITEMVTFNAVAEGGSGQYEYRFGTIHNGTEYYGGYEHSYSESSSLITNLYSLAFRGSSDTTIITGNNTLFVDVKDTVSGNVVRKTIDNYIIKGLEITSFTATTQSGKFKVGETIDLAVTVVNEADYRYNSRIFSYSTDNGATYKDIYLMGSFRYAIPFYYANTPGNYKFKYSITDNIGQHAEKVIDVTVVPNQAIIYYDNASWNNANIHYCVDDGSWTDVPGVQMQASDLEGYAWKYVIDLGTKDGVTVCFNNGNNSWDSCNGNNYRVGNGVYVVKNGKVNRLDSSNSITLYYNNTNWSNANIHYGINGSWTNVPGVQMQASDNPKYTWKYVIYLGDASSAQVCFNNGNGQWDNCNGANYKFTSGTYSIDNGEINSL